MTDNIDTDKIDNDKDLQTRSVDIMENSDFNDKDIYLMQKEIYFFEQERSHRLKQNIILPITILNGELLAIFYLLNNAPNVIFYNLYIIIFIIPIFLIFQNLVKFFLIANKQKLHPNPNEVQAFLQDKKDRDRLKYLSSTYAECSTFTSIENSKRASLISRTYLWIFIISILIILMGFVKVSYSYY